MDPKFQAPHWWMMIRPHLRMVHSGVIAWPAPLIPCSSCPSEVKGVEGTYSSAAVFTISFLSFSHSGRFAPYPRHCMPNLVQLAQSGFPSSHLCLVRVVLIRRCNDRPSFVYGSYDILSEAFCLELSYLNSWSLSSCHHRWRVQVNPWSRV